MSSENNFPVLEPEQRDIRPKLRKAWRHLQVSGLVFAELGIAPTYALDSVWPSLPPAKEDVIGGVSAILWTLTLVVLLKYIFLATEREGGAFSLYLGLPFHDSAKETTETNRMEDEGNDKPSSVILRTLPRRLNWLIMGLAFIGAGMSLTGNILTSSLVVTNTVGAIELVYPQVANSLTFISIGAVLLFSVAQRFGAHRLMLVIAPICLIWFLLLGLTGFINIRSHPGILRAFDPSRAVMLFARTRNINFIYGVLLVVNGCDNLFASVARFDLMSMRLTLAFLVYPTLILTYLGQGAVLIARADTMISDVFWHSITGGVGGYFFWAIYAFTILVSLVSQQASLCCTFNLTQQLVNTGSFPPFHMKHIFGGGDDQPYISFANYFSAIGNITVIAIAQSYIITNAFGFATAIGSLVTTTFLALQMHFVQHAPFIYTWAFCSIFFIIDAIFVYTVSSALLTGGWLPLVIGLSLAGLSAFWTWAKGLEDEFYNIESGTSNLLGSGSLDQSASSSTADSDSLKGTRTIRSDVASAISNISGDSAADKVSIDMTFAGLDEDGFSEQLTTAGAQIGIGDPFAALEDILARDPKVQLERSEKCVVFHRAGSGLAIPRALQEYLRSRQTLPNLAVFLSEERAEVPWVELDDRYDVRNIRILHGFYTVTYRMGYREDFDIDMNEIFERICALEAREASAGEAKISAQNISRIRAVAAMARIDHVRPISRITSKGLSRNFRIMNHPFCAFRRFLIEDLYKPATRMFPETTNWRTVPDDRTGITHMVINAAI